MRSVRGAGAGRLGRWFVQIDELVLELGDQFLLRLNQILNLEEGRALVAGCFVGDRNHFMRLREFSALAHRGALDGRNIRRLTSPIDYPIDLPSQALDFRLLQLDL